MGARKLGVDRNARSAGDVRSRRSRRWPARFGLGGRQICRRISCGLPVALDCLSRLPDSNRPVSSPRAVACDSDRAASVRGPRGLGARSGASQSPKLFEDFVEPLSLDELHRVVMHTFLRTDAKDRYDIRVVQAGGRTGLELEPLEVGRTGQTLLGQDLESDMPAERLLHGLVDDAHSPTADLAKDQVVAEDPRGRTGEVLERKPPTLPVAIPPGDWLSSSSTRAGRIARISSASSGYLMAYSSMLGRSPERNRAMNESASSSIGSRSSTAASQILRRTWL